MKENRFEVLAVPALFIKMQAHDNNIKQNYGGIMIPHFTGH